MHALEYLVAGLIMIIFISFSSAVIMPSVYIPLTHIKEQQLDVLAERITDKILLTPGNPYDWQIVEISQSQPIKNSTILYPDGVISNQNWNVYPATSEAYEVLKDNNNNTYIYTSGKSNKIIQLSISDPLGLENIKNVIDITSVIIYICGKSPNSGKITINLTAGGSVISTGTETIGKDWTIYPFNSSRSWSWDEITSLSVVISVDKNKDVYLSELWVVVEYKLTLSVFHSKELNGFGLALYEEDAKSLAEPYVLDRDKVLRLTEEGVQLNPLDVARSLGLMEDNHLKYGFHITIKPALNISTSVKSTTGTSYSKELYKTIHVKVINYENKPLANAKVYGLAILFYIDGNNVELKYVRSMSTTDVLGEADITYDYTSVADIISQKPSGTFDYTFLYITYVDFYGLKSYTIDALSDVETPAMVVPTEDGITVLHNESEIPRGAVHMRGVFGVSVSSIMSEGGANPSVYNIWVRTKGAESLNIINHGGKEYIYYSLTGVEQELNAIGICFKWTGNFHFYVVSLHEIIGKGLSYGTSESVGSKKVIVIAKRIVRIEGMDYVFELKMWRMAED
jgi:hypothetical protein